jgi:hypothetical protein
MEEKRVIYRLNLQHMERKMAYIKDNSTIDETMRDPTIDTDKLWATILNSGKLGYEFSPDEDGKLMLRELLPIDAAIAAGKDSKLYQDCQSAYSTLMDKLRTISYGGKIQDARPRTHREMATANGSESNETVIRKREGPYRGVYGHWK